MLKKLLVILMAGLLFCSMTAMDTQVVITDEDRAEAVRVFFDDMVEMYKDTNPEMAAYYAKWREIDIPDPFPAEWRGSNGNFKDFVTLEMLNEKFHGSVMEEYILDEPTNELGQVPMETFYVEYGDGMFSIETLYTAAGKENQYTSHKDDMIELCKTIK